MTLAPLIATLMALTALVVAVATGWMAAACAALAIRRVENLAAPTRAVLLAQARLLPLASAAVLVPAQVVAFARFEAGGAESAGPLLFGTGLVGLGLLVDGAVAGFRSWRRTHTVIAAWRESASPLALPAWTRAAWSIRRRFPVVAVVGIVKPQLFVASRVAAACTRDELTAIAAHEAAHVRSGDNLLRFLYCVTPGARLASRIAEPLERAWMVAAEEAADARARLTSSNVELASALTKVARMAAGSTPELLPVSALIGRSDLDSRVRRLLDPPVSRGRTSWAWLPMSLLVLTLGVLSVTTPALADLHDFFELLVRRH